MKKSALLLIAILTANTLAFASTYYGFKIGGVAVNSDNYKNVTGNYIKANYDGAYSVVYDPTTNTVTLDNVKIERTGSDNRCIFNENNSGLKVVIKNSCYFSSTTCAAIRIEANTTISGDTPDALLRVNCSDGDANCVYVVDGATLTLDHLFSQMYLTGNTNSTIEAKGNGEKLVVHHSRLTASSEGGSAIVDFAEVTSDNSLMLMDINSSSKQAVSNVSAFNISANPNPPVVGYANHISNVYEIHYTGTAQFSSGQKTFISGGSALKGQDIIITTYIYINSDIFPDQAFRGWLLNKFGSTISSAELITVRDIDFTTYPELRDVKNWEGIQYLPCLRSLDFRGGSANTFGDLTKCSDLTYLNCSQNNMTQDDWKTVMNNLPKVAGGKIYTFVSHAYNDGNVLPRRLHVATAYSRNWQVFTDRGEIRCDEDYTPIDRDFFPDYYFRKTLYELDFGSDCILYDSENKTLTEVKLPAVQTSTGSYAGQITDVTGIEYFTNMAKFTCEHNRLVSIDVSKNPKLKSLYCSSNRITAEGWDRIIENLHGNEIAIYGYLNGYSGDSNAKPTFIQVSEAKKKNCTLYYYLTSWQPYSDYVAINYNNFPDANFRKYLLSRDFGADERLYADEALTVDMMLIDVKGIADLTGIQYFPNLGYLRADGNKLEKLDLRDNTKLYDLSCDNNGMTELYLPESESLTRLSCNSNNLTSLDVSGHSKLRYLSANFNQLSSLKLGNNNVLEYLYCAVNQLKGEAMDQLIAELPSSIVEGEFHIINTNSAFTEGNEMTAEQVAAAIARGVTPYCYDGQKWVPYPIEQQFERGDVNEDGNINAGDVSALYSVILGTDITFAHNADLNNDGNVNAGDVSTLYELILAK